MDFDNSNDRNNMESVDLLDINNLKKHWKNIHY